MGRSILLGEPAFFSRYAFVLLVLLCTPIVTVATSLQASASRLQQQEPPRTEAISPDRIISASPVKGNFTNFTVASGLSHNRVTHATVDDIGNLWFGTVQGLNCFDGRTFKAYSTRNGLDHNRVMSLFKDRSGNLWMGTEGGGLTCYDGRKFKTYTIADGLSGKLVHAIFQDQSGTIWLGTSGSGIKRFDGKQFVSLDVGRELQDSNITFIFQDKEGMMWFGTVSGGLIRYDGKQVEQVTRKHGLLHNCVWNIDQDDNGDFWLGTEGGLCRYDGLSFSSFTTAQGLPDNSIQATHRDAQGFLWVGTSTGGVCRFDGKQFDCFSTREGLAFDQMHSIVADRLGNVWFLTLGGGLSRYEGKTFTYIPSTDARLEFTKLLQDKDGNIWLATNRDGFVRFDGKSFTTFQTKEGSLGMTITALFEDSKGNLWFGSKDGLLKYNQKTLVTYTTTQGLPQNDIQAITEDNQGGLWVATSRGVARFDGETFHIQESQLGLNFDHVRAFFADSKRRLWIGTDRGAIVYNGKTFSTITSDKSALNNHVLNIAEDANGYIWLGTLDGLNRYDGKSLLSFTQIENLPSEMVYGLKIDSQNRIWIATGRGYATIRLKDKTGNTIEAGDFWQDNDSLKARYSLSLNEYPNKIFSTSFKDIQPNAMMISKLPFPLATGGGDDVILGLIGDNRIIRFNPNEHKRAVEHPKIVLTQVALNGSKTPWYTLLNDRVAQDSALIVQQEISLFGRALTAAKRDTLLNLMQGVAFDSIRRFYPVPEGLVVPYHLNEITFEFNALETGRNELVRYQWRLGNEEWSPADERFEATFSNLWEGRYTFQVRSQSPDGVWSVPVSYSFKVLPPLWREPWMYALYAIAIFASLFVVIKWRERELRQEKLRLENLVNERTTEVVKQMNEANHQRKLVEQINSEIARQLDQTRIDLSNQTIHMIQRKRWMEELESEIKKQAATGGPLNGSRITSLINLSNSLEKEWDNFNAYFNHLHQNFFRSICTLNPGLTIHEQRLCALLKMGMENREIAMLLNIEVGSVKVAKYRVKKKLNLSESDDLTEYINKL